MTTHSGHYDLAALIFVFVVYADKNLAQLPVLSVVRSRHCGVAIRKI
ncbi:hypothetical protein [Ochrobactrum sp. SFR4]|nr:hypothetical protein [Ochrobactrum sp. SFR4]